MSEDADTIYTYSEARQNLATLLDKAIRDGEVRIRRKDGQIFVILPELTSGSPLDVEGVDIDLTRDEIVEFIHEGRKYRQ
jgi:PAS domain-containing protein